MASVNNVQKILEEGLKNYKDFKQGTSKPTTRLGDYILEQCGKNWRVKKIAYPSDELKTGWLTYKEAEALLKIFKSGEEHGNS